MRRESSRRVLVLRERGCLWNDCRWGRVVLAAPCPRSSLIVSAHPAWVAICPARSRPPLSLPWRPTPHAVTQKGPEHLMAPSVCLSPPFLLACSTKRLPCLPFSRTVFLYRLLGTVSLQCSRHLLQWSSLARGCLSVPTHPGAFSFSFRRSGQHVLHPSRRPSRTS